VLPVDIDLAALLAPASEALPAGDNLREDISPKSIYYRLRDARGAARAAERAADSNPDDEASAIPQWREVRSLTLEALTGRTKDLELAAWLTESLVRTDGLAGLAAGARVIAGLAGKFWDQNLYPLPDEDGLGTRVAPVSGLNGEGGDGTLIQPLRKLILFNRPDGSPVMLYQYQESERTAGIADAARRKQRLDAGVPAFDTLEGWAKAAGAARFGVLRTAVTEARNAWAEMTDVLDAKAATQAPSTSRVRGVLDELYDIAARHGPIIAPELPATDETNTVAGEASAVSSVPGGSREEMLQELARVAAWFRRAEPQSPLAYTLDEAVRRARMTWPELLAELVDDASSRHAILNSLGIRPP
jgi:type VI secretion system protein ImpA